MYKYNIWYDFEQSYYVYTAKPKSKQKKRM